MKDRFEKTVAKQKQLWTAQRIYIRASTAVILLRNQHAAMVRMVKRLSQTICVPRDEDNWHDQQFVKLDDLLTALAQYKKGTS